MFPTEETSEIRENSRERAAMRWTWEAHRDARFWVSVSIPRGWEHFFFKVPVFSAFRMGLRLKSWHPNALEVCSRFRSRTTKPGCIFYKLSHSSNIFFHRDFRSGDLLCVRVPRSVRVVCARVDGCAVCISWKCARFSKYPDLIKLIKFQMRVRSTLLLPWVSVNNTYQRN